MRRIFKTIVSFFLIPLTRWYLTKERTFSYKGISIKVRPGVFHPGLFRSTVLLLDYMSNQPLRDCSLLELGSGSGIIAVTAARAGAHVTATDLSQKAVDNTSYNALSNHVNIRVIHSDLFDKLKRETFDWIVINPPYYPRVPRKEEDLAWFCGKDFEYFRKLFDGLGNYIHSTSVIIMVFTASKELELIQGIGKEREFAFELLQKTPSLLDGYDVIYRIYKVKHSPGPA